MQLVYFNRNSIAWMIVEIICSMLSPFLYVSNFSVGLHNVHFV